MKCFDFSNHLPIIKLKFSEKFVSSSDQSPLTPHKCFVSSIYSVSEYCQPGWWTANSWDCNNKMSILSSLSQLQFYSLQPESPADKLVFRFWQFSIYILWNKCFSGAFFHMKFTFPISSCIYISTLSVSVENILQYSWQELHPETSSFHWFVLSNLVFPVASQFLLLQLFAILGQHDPAAANSSNWI